MSASLLIVDARLTQQNGFHSMHETSGSASLWWASTRNLRKNTECLEYFTPSSPLYV
jgi:hypothetical protein